MVLRHAAACSTKHETATCANAFAARADSDSKACLVPYEASTHRKSPSEWGDGPSLENAVGRLVGMAIAGFAPLDRSWKYYNSIPLCFVFMSLFE